MYLFISFTMSTISIYSWPKPTTPITKIRSFNNLIFESIYLKDLANRAFSLKRNLEHTTWSFDWPISGLPASFVIGQIDRLVFLVRCSIETSLC